MCHFEERNDEKSSTGLYGFLTAFEMTGVSFRGEKRREIHKTEECGFLTAFEMTGVSFRGVKRRPDIVEDPRFAGRNPVQVYMDFSLRSK